MADFIEPSLPFFGNPDEILEAYGFDRSGNLKRQSHKSSLSDNVTRLSTHYEIPRAHHSWVLRAISRIKNWCKNY